MMSEIKPCPIEIPQSQLDDLRTRLENTRWIERETPDDWSQGIPLDYMREIHASWLNDYDWRVCEARLNGFGSFITEIDGLDIHFLHIRSPYENARPLVLTHGWPGSVVEFFDLIPMLTDPTSHGGTAEQAFHLVVPSLPGYGFSGKPTAPGWDINRIGRAWGTLMARLGYTGYVAQGGDWGSIVSMAVARENPDHCKAVHVNMLVAPPDPDTMDNLTEAEQQSLADFQIFNENETGYSSQQKTRPQTLGYGLVDSPIGQAAWVLEKFHAWTDCSGHPENVISRTALLVNVMMYWLTASAGSSARLYWESYGDFAPAQVHQPVGCSVFPKEIIRPSRRWAEKTYTNIVFWNVHAKGGHFAALERPAALAEDIRACFDDIEI